MAAISISDNNHVLLLLCFQANWFIRGKFFFYPISAQVFLLVGFSIS
jgi:hypothetical protein